LVTSLEGKQYKGQALERIATALEDDRQETREVAILLVGIGAHPGIERIQGMLSDLGVDVRVVSLNAFRDSAGHVVLTRSDPEADETLDTEQVLSQEAALDSIRHRSTVLFVSTWFCRGPSCIRFLRTCPSTRLRSWSRSRWGFGHARKPTCPSALE